MRYAVANTSYKICDHTDVSKQRITTNLNAYEFIAPEIKQRTFRLNGLFKTKEEYSDLPLYFVELLLFFEKRLY